MGLDNHYNNRFINEMETYLLISRRNPTDIHHNPYIILKVKDIVIH